MMTPKSERSKLRKKSLNYQAQVIGLHKNLFKDTEKASSLRRASGKSNCPKKITGKPVSSKNQCMTILPRDASWFCSVCSNQSKLSMRQCSVCGVWYHEECVGLQSDDEDNFISMSCD